MEVETLLGVLAFSCVLGCLSWQLLPISACSTSLSGGNQVDGLPPARHTEAVGVCQGPIGSAPIGALGPRKLKIDWNSDLRLPVQSNQVF